jgi:hypothetical protein
MVLVFWNERLILLAVPKTGTTALEDALAHRAALVLRDPPPLKHATPQRLRRFVLPLLAAAGGEGWETVAVIREPVSWLSSWYRYRRRDAIAGQPKSTRAVTFEEFVAEWLADRPAPWAAVGSQAPYAVARDGSREATHLFRHEEPDRLRRFLERRLGLDLDLSRTNASPALDTPISPALLGRLRAERPREFAAWKMAG